MTAVTTLSDFSAVALEGGDVDLSTYAGQVVLVVNTASACGLTPQYAGLQALQDKYADEGFTVLGFPCDQFANQEPGSDEEIAGFCQRNYGVTFPMFSKIDVHGPDAHPLFTWLRDEQDGEDTRPVKWNFTKFLVARDGETVTRYSHRYEPLDLDEFIEKALTD